MAVNEVTFSVEGSDRELHIIDFDVRQDATPLAPGDSSGSVGDASVSVQSIRTGRPAQRTAGFIGRQSQLTETVDIEYEGSFGRGVTSGRITQAREAGGRTTYSIDSILAPLNADREAPPFYGVPRSAPLITARENLSPNPSYLNSVNGVTVLAGTGVMSVAQATEGGADGGSFAQATWTTASTASGSRVFGASVPVTAGASYTFSHFMQYVRAGVGAGSAGNLIQASIGWYNASNALISYSVGAPFLALSGDWNRASVTDSAPTGAVTARPVAGTVSGAGFVNPAVGDQLGIDMTLIEQSSVLNNYFDGSSPNGIWNGALGESTSSLRVYGPIPAPNYNATQANAFRYYFSLVGIPDAKLVIDQAFEGVPVAYPAWKGNVWEKVKQLCTAVGADIVPDQDLIYIRQKRRYVVNHDSTSSLDVSVDALAKAQTVGVYNYNNRWQSNAVAHADSGTYSVNANSTQYRSVKTDHSFDQVNNPIAVGSIPSLATYSGGTGVYVVRDSDDKIVDPVSWTKAGGYVQARYDGVYGEFTLIIKAPAEIEGYKAPYKIGETSSDAPGILITASGVFSDKQLVMIPTGAGPEQTSIIEAATVDNPFLSDITTTYDRGSFAAQAAGGPIVTLQGTLAPGTPAVPKGSGAAGAPSFGPIAGARITAHNNIFRIVSYSSTLGSTAISAVADMTFDDMTELYSSTFDELDITYAGLTFDQFDSLWTGQTFDQFDAAQPRATFDDFDAIFAGMTFDQHTVTPYLEKVILDDPEASF